jgi:hypothetical protein
MSRLIGKNRTISAVPSVVIGAAFVEFPTVIALNTAAAGGLDPGYYLVTGRVTYWDGVKFEPYLLPVDRGDLPSISGTALGLTVANFSANFAPYVVVDSAYDYFDFDTYASDMDADDGP